MKILIKHSSICSEEHFKYLKQIFESQGFEVLDKNLQCFVTELNQEDLNKVDYVLDFEKPCFVHVSIIERLKTLFEAKTQDLKFVGCLYFNNEMGLLQVDNAVVGFAYSSNILLTDIFSVLDNPVIVQSNGFAIELTDTEFILQKGRFKTEFLTKEMLYNGNWTISSKDNNTVSQPSN